MDDTVGSSMLTLNIFLHVNYFLTLSIPNCVQLVLELTDFDRKFISFQPAFEQFLFPFRTG